MLFAAGGTVEEGEARSDGGAEKSTVRGVGTLMVVVASLEGAAYSLRGRRGGCSRAR